MIDASKVMIVAFDCFGTVFDMSDVPREQIKEYVDHVRREDYSPFKFPDAWWRLKPHADAADGIRELKKRGAYCIAASNGSPELIGHISSANGIRWDRIIDFRLGGTYKPKPEAYREIVVQSNAMPGEILMVTANPTFGDVEGSQAIGMQCQVIRQPGTPQTIVELAEMF